MDVMRRRAIVHGRVQGVGFRVTTRSQARSLGLTGFARNLPDGTVEIEVEGAESAVDTLLAWLQGGPPTAQVHSIEVDNLDVTGGDDFTLC